MNITGIGSRSSLVVQSLIDMRRQLDELQRQLGTGTKSETYAGLGVDRGFAVGLRAHISTLAAFDDAVDNVGIRLNLAQSALGRVGDISRSLKSQAFQTPNVQSNGSTIAQATAYQELDEVLALLNTRSGDRYLFSGRAADQPAVESLDHIMNGEGARAGFKQAVAERRLADLGAGGLGRLAISALPPTGVEVEEDALSPFGFKLAGISATLTGATQTGPAGSPPAVSVDLGATNPNVGETIRLSFTLPDGSSESITLTATASTTPGAGEFAIAATSDLTAANLQAALTAAVGKLASTSLTAASAVAAGNDFFGSPPQRVAGPPFDSATTLVAGTSANTVLWYTGEDGGDPARATAIARVDVGITVSYGLRANEEGLRWVVQNIAAFAAMTSSPADPDAMARAAALHQRIASNLAVPTGTQKVEEIAAELAGVQTVLEAAADRHRQTKGALADLLQQIEGVPTEEVAAQILALQTRLQASLQTTSLLYQTSLVNYL